MLMMLALFGVFGKKTFAADAHVAGLVWGFGKNPLRLMLMMLALFGGFWQTLCG